MPETSSDWPAGGGETGALMRGMDWGQTVLGPPAGWPQSLKTCIDLMLPAQTQIVLFWGPQFVAFYNDTYAPTIGRKHPHALGQPASVYWSELWDDLGPLLEGVRTTGRTLSAHDRPFQIERHGYLEEVYFDISYSPVRGEHGEVAGVLCLVRETTERVRSERARQQAEAALEATNHHFRMAQAAGGIGVFSIDLASNTLHASAEFCQLFGLPPADAMPASAVEALADREGAEQMSTSDSRADGSAPLDAEYRIRRADDGRLRWIARRAEFVRDRLGRPLQMRGVVQDVTERKAAELTLRESEARFRELAQAVPNQVWTATADGLLDWFNEQVYDYCGLGHDDLVGDGWSRVVHADDYPRAAHLWMRALESRTRFDTEYRLRRHDGSYRWHLVRAIPVTGAGGELRWIGTTTDIHDQKTAQDELASLNVRLEERVEERTRDRDRIWRLSTDAMLVARFDGTIVAINPAWKNLLGWDEAELLGKSFFPLVHPDDVERTAVEARRLSAGLITVRFDNRALHKDGRWRTMSWTAVPDAEFIHAIGRDITDQLAAATALAETQDRLRQSQKMEAVGQLTGGIAHDFNNLLQGIIGSLDMVRKRAAQQRHDEAERFVTSAVASAQRAAALTHRLLAFSRRQPLDPRPVKANPLVHSMEDLLRRTLGEHVALELVLAAGLWVTLCDPNQLENAILNLAINARDAMPQGGRLTIETCNTHLDSAYALSHGGLEPGQYVCISVTDTGVGMTADVVERAFDPFFTTKPMGQGTGLGLSMIYGFARQSEGACRIYSEPGRGTTVKLYLPRNHAGEAVEAQTAERPAAQPVEASEVVLVVEDEEIVRALILEVLAELGYRALEAADGPSGLALLEAEGRIDLLVTDIGLPGLNGRQMVDAARHRRPDLQVLFMTGYAENAAIANGFLEPGMAMITKPFSMDTLAARMQDMIGSGRPQGG
ncbi:MAG: PAS domain S-box protein [Aquabacterium sp.]|nr:MAG: PAS domain S-box protein [Aquabacterium sp.]